METWVKKFDSWDICDCCCSSLFVKTPFAYKKVLEWCNRKEEYEKRLGDFKDYVYVIKSGSPDVEIIRYAKKNDIDMIVMGALGKSEQDRIVHGSTVTNVSKYAHCHVVAIRNPAKQYTLPDTMY